MKNSGFSEGTLAIVSQKRVLIISEVIPKRYKEFNLNSHYG